VTSPQSTTRKDHPLTFEQIKTQAKRQLELNVVTYRPQNSEIASRILSLVNKVLTFPLKRQEQFIRSKEETLCAIVKTNREQKEITIAEWKSIYTKRNLKRAAVQGTKRVDSPQKRVKFNQEVIVKYTDTDVLEQ